MKRFKSAPLPKDNNCIRKVFSTVFLSSYPEKKYYSRLSKPSMYDPEVLPLGM